MAERKEIPRDEFIRLMQESQKKVWGWEDKRNFHLPILSFLADFSNGPGFNTSIKGMKDYKESAGMVKGMDNIFIQLIEPTRRDRPRVILKINKELDVFIGQPRIEGEEIPMPRPIIDITRRKLYDLSDYLKQQGGGSMGEQHVSDENLEELEEIEHSLKEVEKTINSLPMTNVNASSSKGGKRNKSKRNKFKRSKKTRRH